MPLKEYFSAQTRDLLKVFVRGLIDCEVSVEIVKQKVAKFMGSNLERGYSVLDRKNSGGVNMSELREFMQENNHFCNEK